MQTTSFCYSIAKSTLQVWVTFLKGEEDNLKISVLFVFFFVKYHLKTLWCIVCILNDCSSTGELPFLVWDSVRTTTSELWSRNSQPVLQTATMNVYLVDDNFAGIADCIAFTTYTTYS